MQTHTEQDPAAQLSLDQQMLDPAGSEADMYDALRQATAEKLQASGFSDVESTELAIGLQMLSDATESKDTAMGLSALAVLQSDLDVAATDHGEAWLAEHEQAVLSALEDQVGEDGMKWLKQVYPAEWLGEPADVTKASAEFTDKAPDLDQKLLNPDKLQELRSALKTSVKDTLDAGSRDSARREVIGEFLEERGLKKPENYNALVMGKATTGNREADLAWRAFHQAITMPEFAFKERLNAINPPDEPKASKPIDLPKRTPKTKAEPHEQIIDWNATAPENNSNTRPAKRAPKTPGVPYKASGRPDQLSALLDRYDTSEGAPDLVDQFDDSRESFLAEERSEGKWLQEAATQYWDKTFDQMPATLQSYLIEKYGQNTGNTEGKLPDLSNLRVADFFPDEAGQQEVVDRIKLDFNFGETALKKTVGGRLFGIISQSNES